MSDTVTLVFLYTQNNNENTKEYTKPKSSSIRDALLEFMRDVNYGTDLATSSISFQYNGRLINDQSFLQSNPTLFHMVRSKRQAQITVMKTDNIIGGKY